MREASTEIVYQLAKSDKRVLALTADGRNAVYERIKSELPSQYIDYGIAESNMIASAAGLASCGKTPFIFGTSTFLAMRAFEFIRNDICIPDYNVKLIGIFCGLSRGSWGATHQGTEDLSILRVLPNLTVITPATPVEAREATKYAYHHNGPVYLRLEASGEPELLEDGYRYSPEKAVLLNEGNDATIITMGSIAEEALEAAERLKKRGKTIRVISISCLKPMDQESVIRACNETGGVITLEEQSKYGGLGSAVAEVLSESGCNGKLVRLGLDGCARGCGDRAFMRKENGIGTDRLMDALNEIVSHQKN